MIALLLAAQLVDPTAAGVAQAMPPEIVSTTSAPHVRVVRLRAPATACPALGIELAAAASKPGATPAQVQTLNKLPKANHEIAVNRMVAGCPAPVVVSYQVGK